MITREYLAKLMDYRRKVCDRGDPQTIIEACSHGEGGICEICAMRAIDAQAASDEYPMECGHPLACNDIEEESEEPICVACECVKIETAELKAQIAKLEGTVSLLRQHTSCLCSHDPQKECGQIWCRSCGLKL